METPPLPDGWQPCKSQTICALIAPVAWTAPRVRGLPALCHDGSFPDLHHDRGHPVRGSLARRLAYHGAPT
jgi:hypothetical protein